MRISFFNKALAPAETKVDPRDRLVARVGYFRDVLASTERKALAGIVAPSELDRARTDLAEAEKALEAFDAEQKQAAAVADHQAQRGTTLLKEAQRLDAEIESIVLMLDRKLAESKPVVEEIDRDFRRGVDIYAEPITATLVERLEFWSRTLVHHAGMTDAIRFEDRLREYRKIGEPPTPVVIHRPTPETKEAKAKRLRQALENSRRRSVMVDGVGITVESR